MFKKTAIFISILLLGIIIGGYMFSDTQPRSVIALHKCEQQCYKANELTGLLASVGIQKLNGLLPNVKFETDKILVVDYPTPRTTYHEVVIPKKDIRDISDITEEDMQYLMETFAYMGKEIREHKLRQYKIVSNGPDYQQMTYLHFHLIGEVRK